MFKIATNLFSKLLFPYNLKQLRQFRMELLKEMRSNGFSYYLTQMNEISNKIKNIMLDDSQIKKDNLWETFEFKHTPSFQSEYWKQESSWINKKYSKKSKLNVSNTVSLFMSEEKVNALMGEADWMTVQQIILFKSVITSYFSNDSRLWPIGLNMDYVFKTQFIESDSIKNESDEEKSQRIGKNNIKIKQWEKEIQTYECEEKKNKMFDIDGKKRPIYPELEIKEKEKSNQTFAFRILKSSLSGSGPFILKILQQINTSNNKKIKSGRGGSLKVADLTNGVFSNIPGLSVEETEFVKKNINFFRDQSIVNNTNPKQLGSASIAEAHFSHSDLYNMDVVIKFAKPMYAYYFLCEINFLLTKTWKKIRKYTESKRRGELYVTQCRRLLMFFINEFISEFNYKQEFVNTTVGYEVYNQKNGPIKSIVAFDYSINPFPALALEKVDGTTVDKELDRIRKIPDKKEKVKQLKKIYNLVDKLIKLWFSKTLWGGGWFHADLHAGNCMISGNNLYLIDFGSVGKLSKNHSCRLISSMIKSANFYQLKPKSNKNQKYKGKEWNEKHKYNKNQAENFINSIWKLCKVKKKYQNSESLDYIVDKILDYKYGLYFSTMMIKVAELSDSVGICITSDILMFGRAIAYLGNMIYQIYLDCNDKYECPIWLINPVIKRNIILNPIRTMRCLVDN